MPEAVGDARGAQSPPRPGLGEQSPPVSTKMVAFIRIGKDDRAMRKTLLTAFALLAFGPPLWAEDVGPPPPPGSEQSGAGGFLSAPDLEPSPVAGASVEPEITIRETERAVIYEYRVRGRMYMVRIQPQFGPPYYLIDTDGNGTLDMRDSSPTNISIPQWILFSWD
jgi:hypothetical protein